MLADVAGAVNSINATCNVHTMERAKAGSNVHNHYLSARGNIGNVSNIVYVRNNGEYFVRENIIKRIGNSIRYIVEDDVVLANSGTIGLVNLSGQRDGVLQDRECTSNRSLEVFCARQLAGNLGISRSIGYYAILDFSIFENAVDTIKDGNDAVLVFHRSLDNAGRQFRAVSFRATVNSFCSDCIAVTQTLISLKRGELSLFVIDCIRDECAVYEAGRFQEVPRLNHRNADFQHVCREVLTLGGLEVNRVRLSYVRVVFENAEELVIEVAIRSGSSAFSDNYLRVRNFCASRVITTDEVYAREQCAQRQSVSFRGIRYINAVFIDDGQFQYVISRVFVEDADSIYEIGVTVHAMVHCQGRLNLHNGVSARYFAAALLKDSGAGCRLVQCESLVAERVVVTDINLFAVVGRITGRHAQLKAVVDSQLEVLVQALAAKTASVDSTAASVPSILNACNQSSLTALSRVVALTKHVAAMFWAVNRNNQASRAVKSGADNYNGIGSAELRSVIRRSTVISDIHVDARQVVFGTKNSTHSLISSYMWITYLLNEDIFNVRQKFCKEFFNFHIVLKGAD